MIRFFCAVLCVSAAGAAAAADAEVQQRLALGRKIFSELARPPCSLCHALRDAGSTANIGPNLNDLQPDAERVAIAVRDGVGVMPPYNEQLSPEQIKAIAGYIEHASRAAK